MERKKGGRRRNGEEIAGVFEGFEDNWLVDVCYIVLS